MCAHELGIRRKVDIYDKQHLERFLAAKQDFALKVALLAQHGYEATLPLKECFQLLQYLLLVVRLW